MTKTCVSACPDDVEDSDGICPKCSSGKYLDTVENKCVETCPNTAPLKGEDFVCKTCKTVSESTPFFNPMTRECVNACPTELIPADGEVCRTCADVYKDDPDEKRYWHPMT